MEIPHAFRNCWPNKKARIQRTHRHSSRRALATADSVEYFSPEPQLGAGLALRKAGTRTLRRDVETKLPNRVVLTASRFFLERHTRTRAADFKRLLGALMLGRTERSAEYA